MVEVRQDNDAKGILGRILPHFRQNSEKAEQKKEKKLKSYDGFGNLM